jgi:hypothetical protein
MVHDKLYWREMPKQISVKRGRIVEILIAFRPVSSAPSFAAVPRLEWWLNPRNKTYGALLWFLQKEIVLVEDNFGDSQQNQFEFEKFSEKYLGVGYHE